jgi:hypothetical protein
MNWPCSKINVYKFVRVLRVTDYSVWWRALQRRVNLFTIEITSLGLFTAKGFIIDYVTYILF